jgi:hypothetical protein
MRRARSSTVAGAALCALLLGAAAARAQDAGPTAPPAEGPVYGSVVVLKDRRAGFLEDVKPGRPSQELSLVRAGGEIPLVAGQTVYEGDAIRSALGTCVVVTPAGWRIEIGERSQVRLEKGVLQRLGEVFYEVRGQFTVRADAVQLLVEGTAFKVSRDIPGNGELAVLDGRVRMDLAGGGGSAPGATATLPDGATEAGQARPFTQAAAGEARVLSQVELEEIAAWRAEAFLPAVAAGTRRDRVHVRFSGGISRFDDVGWGRFGLSGRVRLSGPAWLELGADAAVRAVDGVEGVRTAFALPAHLGARFLAELPRSFFISGGGDFTLFLGQRCADASSCRRVFAAQPGGRIALGAGTLIGRRLGLDIEVSGGLLRRTLPPLPGLADELSIPDLQLHLAVGLFGRL